MKANRVKNSIKTMLIAFIIFNVSISVLGTNFSMKAYSTDRIMPPDRPTVFIDPQNATAGMGENVTFSVKVFNLTDALIRYPPPIGPYYWLGNLYGLGIQLYWDPTILNATSRTVKIPVETYPDGVLHNPVNIFTNEVNATAGVYDLAAFCLPPAERFNNPGNTSTIVEITFKVIGRGSCYIRLNYTDLAGYDPEHEPPPPVPDYPIYHHPEWPYPGFISDALFEFAGAPVAKFTMWPSDVAVANKTVLFNASESYDPVGYVTLYMWDFGDGTQENTTIPIIEHNFTSTGTFQISLTVMNDIGLRSAPATKSLTVVSYREVIVERLISSDKQIKLGLTLSISVTVKNAGEEVPESFNLTVCYNGTIVDWSNITAAEWVKIGEKTVSLNTGAERTVTFLWNTIDVIPEKYYGIMANITTVIPHEEDVTNNFVPRPPKIPPVIVFVTNVTKYELVVKSVETMVIGVHGNFFPPVVSGEKVAIKVKVAREGTVYETFNATLKIIHPNGTILNSTTWPPTELGSTKLNALLTYEFLTEGLTNGDYDVNATVVNSNATLAQLDTNKTNNSMSKKFKVVEPPILNFTTLPKPDNIYVNDAVTLNATASTHPGGNITKYYWTVSRGEVELLRGGPTTTVTLNDTGMWNIVLVVSDSNGISYDDMRPATSSYRLALSVTVSPTPFPIELILAAIAAVAVIVGCLAYLRKRRKG